MTNKHALLSASGSNRWVNCTPSARFEENEPNTTSDFAHEGTIAHETAAVYLENALAEDPKKLTKAFFQQRILGSNEEMVTNAEKYCDFVEEQIFRLSKNKDTYIESRVDFSLFAPKGFGTVDFFASDPKNIVIIDYKYGKGVQVNAKENTQLVLYALGALQKLEEDLIYPENVTMCIFQPRINNTSIWEISVNELLMYGESIKKAAKLAFKGEGKFSPGEWCRFCKAAYKCKALAKKVFNCAASDINQLTDLEILQNYKNVKLLDFYAKSIKKHVLEKALNGHVWEGYKLVEGRVIRKWSDENLAIKELKKGKFLKKDYTKTELKNRTDLIKLTGREFFNKNLAPLLIAPHGAPTVVPDDDPRPSYITAQDVFA